MKKEGLAILFLLVVIGISGVNANGCSIVSEGACADEIVMYLSDEISANNAHGQSIDYLGTKYDNVLCCDFGYNVNDCGTSSEYAILKLENSTNSHAEDPDGSTYTNDVCYENFECELKNLCDTNNEIEVLTLDGNFDAHIGKPGTPLYEKICCEPCPSGENWNSVLSICEPGPPPPLTPEANWTDLSNNIIAEINEVETGITQVRLRLRYSTEGPGTNVEFEIFEKDYFLNLDDSIREMGDSDELAVGTILGSDNTSIITWTITEDDISDAETEDFYEFYFKADDGSGTTYESNILKLYLKGSCNFNYCNEYEDKISCEDDCGDTAKQSVEEKFNVECGTIIEGGCEFYRDCSCMWDSVDSECEANWTWKVISCKDPPGLNFEAGTCAYDEDSSDDCDDGWFEYSWNSDWTWNSGNNFNGIDLTGLTPEQQNQFRDVAGVTRYDPYIDGVRVSETCEPGENTVPCPAQVQLRFFSWAGAIIALVIIFAFYAVSIKKKK